jgi:hypothetical protein
MTVTLSKDEAETIIQALSAGTTDEMRYTAWEILDSKIKHAAEERARIRNTRQSCR